MAAESNSASHSLIVEVEADLEATLFDALRCITAMVRAKAQRSRDLESR